MKEVLIGIVSFFIGKKKRKADLRITELGAIHEAAGIWKEINVELRAMVETLTQKCEALTLEVAALRKENGQLRLQIRHLEESINKMK